MSASPDKFIAIHHRSDENQTWYNSNEVSEGFPDDRPRFDLVHYCSTGRIVKNEMGNEVDVFEDIRF